MVPPPPDLLSSRPYNNSDSSDSGSYPSGDDEESMDKAEYINDDPKGGSKSVTDLDPLDESTTTVKTQDISLIPLIPDMKSLVKPMMKPWTRLIPTTVT